MSYCIDNKTTCQIRDDIFKSTKVSEVEEIIEVIKAKRAVCAITANCESFDDLLVEAKVFKKMLENDNRQLG